MPYIPIYHNHGHEVVNKKTSKSASLSLFIVLRSDCRPQPYSAESAEVLDSWDYTEAKPHSYLDAIRAGLDGSAAASSFPEASHQPLLCPYAAAGQCHFGDTCPYLHGDMCEICRLQVLHPYDPEQRAAHEKVSKEGQHLIVGV